MNIITTLSAFEDNSAIFDSNLLTIQEIVLDIQLILNEENMSISATDNNNHSSLKNTATHQSNSYSIRKIESSDTVKWLRKGIDDFKASNINSLLYGLMFVIAGGLTIWYTRGDPVFIMALVTGFYLVGPSVATGLYDISRRLEKGEKASFIQAIAVFGQNIRCLSGLTLILGSIMVAWTGVASLIVNAFFEGNNGIAGLVTGEQAAPFLGILLIGGTVLALLASTISIVFLPLLNNRKMGTITMLVILGVIMLTWVRTMVLAINTFLDNSVIVTNGWNALTGDPQFMPFLIVFLLVGLVFAAAAFTISVIAVPMIIHRRVTVLTAISTSIQAVKTNPLPMFRWAATIAVLIAVGLGLFFVGLAITLPIIGHASWHAYKEIVVENEA